MSGFVHVGSAARLIKLTRGSSRVYACNGEDVAVFRTKEGYIAVSDTCPHMGASLSHGRLIGNQLECGWHEWRFDTGTGVSDAREWCCINVYDVKIDGGELYLRQRPRPEAPRKPQHGEGEDEDWIRWDPEQYFRKKEGDGND